MSDTASTRFICKICGSTFEDQSILNQHIADSHHPKRTVTINDIVNGVFEGKINFPKTKAEIVKEVEEQKKGISKNKPEITPEIIDVIRDLPDRRYNDEADLALGIEQQQQQEQQKSR
ncbi:MAG: hypothetical protein ACJ73C_12600 [Nitrososphaeraceae archaeon]